MLRLYSSFIVVSCYNCEMWSVGLYLCSILLLLGLLNVYSLAKTIRSEVDI